MLIPEIKILRFCAVTDQRMEVPADALRFWQQCVEAADWFEPDRECVVAAALNPRLRVTGWRMIAVGTLNDCSLHPREILRFALIANAASFVLMHNHPTGDPAPSVADINFTIGLREAARVVQIPLQDHVIVGDERPEHPHYCSLREQGYC
ncbi:MAG: JAB domain-containing protein [Verrucomicrobiales bacterium]|jgi:DNA repair protein RadC|nr:JAB domain-containing protein [Verrucomicrobiales bacterium]